MVLDIPGAHSLAVHANNSFLNTTQVALVFVNNDRLMLAVTIAGDGQLRFTELTSHGFLAMAVTTIPSLLALRSLFS